jgi:hypothetical protein
MLCRHPDTRRIGPPWRLSTGPDDRRAGPTASWPSLIAWPSDARARTTVPDPSTTEAWRALRLSDSPRNYMGVILSAAEAAGCGVARIARMEVRWGGPDCVRPERR